MGDNVGATDVEKKSRNAYSLKKKLQCIATAKRLNNIDRAAELEGVPRTCLLRWMPEEKKFKDASKARGKNTKKLTLGRPVKLKEFDTGLAEWIKERRAQKQKITYALIMREAALRLRKIPSGTTSLKLSIGWRQRFLHRHRLTLRKPTSVAQRAPADYAEKIIKFIEYTEQLRKKEKFKHVYGADETGIWLNPSGGLCVEQIGAKDVSLSPKHGFT
ncbi:pogo transposable element with KRAB domain-like protein [Aphelenchoides avenae]|nr:pogo transposable element with KRAB domain-like protein [Aphelenchus avenae]